MHEVKFGGALPAAASLRTSLAGGRCPFRSLLGHSAGCIPLGSDDFTSADSADVLTLSGAAVDFFVAGPDAAGGGGGGDDAGVAAAGVPISCRDGGVFAAAVGVAFSVGAGGASAVFSPPSCLCGDRGRWCC